MRPSTEHDGVPGTSVAAAPRSGTAWAVAGVAVGMLGWSEGALAKAWDDPLAFSTGDAARPELVTALDVRRACDCVKNDPNATATEGVKTMCGLPDQLPSSITFDVPTATDVRGVSCKAPNKLSGAGGLGDVLGGLANLLSARVGQELQNYLERKVMDRVCRAAGEDAAHLRTAQLLPSVCAAFSGDEAGPRFAAELPRAALADLVAAPRNLAEEELRLSTLSSGTGADGWIALGALGRTGELVVSGEEIRASVGAWASSRTRELKIGDGGKPALDTSLDLAHAPVSATLYLVSEVAAVMPALAVSYGNLGWSVKSDDATLPFVPAALLVTESGGQSLTPDWWKPMAKVDLGKPMSEAAELREDLFTREGPNPGPDSARKTAGRELSGLLAIGSELAPDSAQPTLRGASETIGSLVAGAEADAIHGLAGMLGSTDDADAVIRLIAMSAAVARAGSPDDVQEALEAYAAPVGSYARKRVAEPEHRLYGTVNGYVGVGAGLEGPSAATLWPTAPVGPEIGWRLGHASLALHVPLVDLGGPVQGQLASDEPGPVDFRQVFAPGAQLLFGPGDLPVVAGVQGTYTPYASEDWHVGAVVAVDVVLWP